MMIKIDRLSINRKKKKLTVKDNSSCSWLEVVSLRRILHKYNLLNPVTLLDNPMSKLKRKRQVKDAVFLYWKDRVIKDCQLYCSLKYLNTVTYQIHHLIKINGNPATESTRLATKLKLETDAYILQTKSVRFRNIEGSALCLLCEDADETVEHFILTCRVLEPIRQSVIDTMDSICTKVSFFPSGFNLSWIPVKLMKHIIKT